MNYQEIFKKIEEKGYRVDNITKFREALKTANIDSILQELDDTKIKVDKDEEVSKDAKEALTRIASVRELLDTDEIKATNKKKDIDDLVKVFNNLELLLFGKQISEDTALEIEAVNAQINENKSRLDSLNKEITEINSQLSLIDENTSLSRDEKHAAFKDLLIKLEKKSKSIEEVKASIKDLQKEKRRLSDKSNKAKKKSDELLNSEEFGGFFKYQDSFGDAMHKLSLPSEISDKIIKEFGEVRRIYRKRTNDGHLYPTEAPHESLDEILSKYGLVQEEKLTESLNIEEPEIVEPKNEEVKKADEKKEDLFASDFNSVLRVFNQGNGSREEKPIMPRSREPEETKVEEKRGHAAITDFDNIFKAFNPDGTERVSARELTISELIRELKLLNPEVDIDVMSSDAEDMSINSITCDVPVKDLKLPEGFYYNDKNGITNKHNTLSGSYVCLHVDEPKKEFAPQQQETVSEEAIQQEEQQAPKKTQTLGVKTNPKRKKVVDVHPAIKATAWASFGCQTAAILGILAFGAPALVSAAILTAVSMGLSTEAAGRFVANLYDKGRESAMENPSSVLDKLKNYFNNSLKAIKTKIKSNGGAKYDGEEEIEKLEELDADNKMQKYVETYYSHMR